MKKVLVGLSLVALLGGQATVALADAGADAFKKNCVACHAGVLAPKPSDIAAAYSGDKAALKTFLTVKGTAPKIAIPKFVSQKALMQQQLDGPVKKLGGDLDAVIDFLIASK
jgi:mono/diheme cytochrome c family protein